jgi:hypothetical protein
MQGGAFALGLAAAVAAPLVAAHGVEATSFEKWGAFAFGAVIGWFLYFTNRYRPTIQLSDVGKLIGAVGGGAVLALFPARTDLFAAYGLGLAAGFLAYFLILVAFVLSLRSKGWSLAWFLDGRRPGLDAGEQPADGSHPMQAASKAIRGE